LGRKIKDKEWLMRQMSYLKVFTNELCKPSNIHYEVHEWTPLKLIAFSYWLGLYTRIMLNQRKKGRFKNIWYLDLLAGPGTNYVKTGAKGEVIAGSPFIAYHFAKDLFTKYVFIEADKERKEALERRVSVLKIPNVDIYHGDCNEVIDRLDLSSADHYLAFIDCEGVDIRWSPTMLKLLKNPGDLLITFQTKELTRTLGRASKGYKDAKVLTDFIGDDRWRKAKTGEELLFLYMDRLKEYRTYVNSIKIECKKFRYDLVLACKMGPYVETWEYLKNRLERFRDKHVRVVLEIMSGKCRTLDEFESCRSLYEYSSNLQA